MCKFGGDPAICLREEAICAKVYRQTDRRTDDGRRAIALAHSWGTHVDPGSVLGKVKVKVIWRHLANSNKTSYKGRENLYKKETNTTGP